MLALANRFDSLFNGIFNDDFFNFASDELASAGGNFLTLEVPGVKREDIDIVIDGRIIQVKWRDRHGRSLFTQRIIGNVTGAKAKLDNGLLTIELERPRESSGKIKVSVE